MAQTPEIGAKVAEIIDALNGMANVIMLNCFLFELKNIV